jgi:hypothetical protein
MNVRSDRSLNYEITIKYYLQKKILLMSMQMSMLTAIMKSKLGGPMKSQSSLYRWMENRSSKNGKIKAHWQDVIELQKPMATADQKADFCVEILLRASVAHWTSDAVEMRAVDLLRQDFSQLETQKMNSDLEELDFLIQSLLSSGEHLEQPTESQNHSLSYFWKCLKWAGFRMSCGHYKDSISALQYFENHINEYPIAYQLRRAVILGISHQAIGNYTKSSSYLDQQINLNSRKQACFLTFAIQRRQLSLLIESENLSSAIEAEKQMDAEFGEVASDFLRSVYLQEKFKIALLSSTPESLKVIREKQEAAIQSSKLPLHLIVPLEERCEIALRESRAKEALHLVSQQAWMSREKGLVNGQLICGMILFRCQMQLGQVLAAHTTARELQYLCTTYGFGRDSVRAQILLALWHFNRLRLQEAWNILVAARNRSLKLALRIHILAMDMFQFILKPTESFFKTHFCDRRFNLSDFNAAHGLCSQWLSVIQWPKPSTHLFLDALTKDLLKLDSANEILRELDSYFLEPFNMWLIVLPRFKQLDSSTIPASDSKSCEIEFEIFSSQFSATKDDAALLKHLCAATENAPPTISEIHNLLFPMVPYVESRHRSRTLNALQRFRVKIKNNFKKIVAEQGEHFKGFGLTEREHFLPNPLPTVWTKLEGPREILPKKQLAASKSELQKLKLKPKRNNAPALEATLEKVKTKILLWLQINGPTSGSQMAEGMGYARKTLHVYLKSLTAENKVILSGLGRNARYKLD